METERLIPIFEAADAVLIPTSYGDNDLDATIELFLPVLRQINETAKVMFIPNRIKEETQKDKMEIRQKRDKTWDRTHMFGKMTARIRDSRVFDNSRDNSRFNTVDPLNHWQANGVKHCFDEIYEELK